MSKKADPTIRNLYPDFSEKAFAEAERNLDLYLALGRFSNFSVHSEP